MQGIEITSNVQTRNDGKPIFLQMGIHHAREWPSGEHAIEWAYELIEGFKNGDERAAQARPQVAHDRGPDRQPGRLQRLPRGRRAAGRGRRPRRQTPTRRRPTSSATRTSTGARTAAWPTTARRATARSRRSARRAGGVDPNRNYGGFWGGPGASTMPSAEDYRGPAPFSEPETRNIRSLFSRQPITAFITNHTFTGLVLRPPGIAAQGPPGGRAAAEAARRADGGRERLHQPALLQALRHDRRHRGLGLLRDRRARLHVRDRQVELPPEFAKTVAEWNGTSPMAGDGGGNRAAYYKIANFVLEKRSHAIDQGQGAEARHDHHSQALQDARPHR